jgi:hypothetical protein
LAAVTLAAPYAGAQSPHHRHDAGPIRVSLGTSLPTNSVHKSLANGVAAQITVSEAIGNGFRVETRLHALQHEGERRAEQRAAAMSRLERMDFSMGVVGASANLTHTHRCGLIPGLRKHAMSVTAGVGVYRVAAKTNARYQDGSSFAYTERENQRGLNIGASLALRKRRALEARYHRIGRGAGRYGFLPIGMSVSF